MNTGQSFGDWLRQRRRAFDLTQEELARLERPLAIVPHNDAQGQGWQAAER
jgi:hypothetical protein